MNFITTKGRAVQVRDAYDIGALPEALHAKFASKFLIVINSYIHTLQVRQGELASITT